MDPRKRAMFVGAFAAIIVVLLIMFRVASTPTMALLYSGLDAAAAGEVVSAIEARGLPYEVRGDAIFVDQTERDGLRLALAGDGLPANGAAGYELLDSLPGFGTTAQMFDAAYWRAKEGELARTIVASPLVRSARVHVGNTSNQPFASRQEVTASVTLRPSNGAVPDTLARSVQFLVSSAVPGLQPTNVTVIDADSGQVIGAAGSDTLNSDGATRADALRHNIERLITARVGPGNAMVEVSVDIHSARETVLERRIDPDSRVIISTDTEERSNSSNNAGNGSVTVASNLPEGDTQGDGETSSQQGTETRERVAYDISEIQRETETSPGDIRRISVAVLVNGVTSVDDNGLETIIPRDEDELTMLNDLVRTAIGFDENRGDQVTIRSMAFERLPETAAEATSAGALSTFDLTRALQFTLLAAVGLALVFGVLRPALTQASGSQSTELIHQPADALTDFQSPETAPSVRTATGEASEISDLPDLSSLGAGLPGIGDAQAWDGEIIGAGSADAIDENDPVERLRRLIQEREAETVEILRSWMEEEDEEGTG